VSSAWDGRLDRWVEAGFPQGDEFEAIVSDALAAAQP